MNWCEIFKTGTNTDSAGITKVWTTEELDTIVRNFSQKKSLVPVVIGHPKENNPAYAWVDKVKRVGERLFCTFKQVTPEFAEWVNKGLYKNRSISLYPDLTLRHVGFLGAVPPAIKGLEQFQFSQSEDAKTYEFSELTDYKFDTLARILQRLRYYLIKQSDVETAEKIISTFSIEDLKQTENKTPEELRAFCEEKGRKEQKLTILEPTADFSEELKKQTEFAEQLKKENEELKAQNRKIEFEQFAEKAVEQGNITPAQKSFVVEFQEACLQGGTYDFAEGEEKSILARFQKFIGSLKQINFSELPSESKETIDFSDPKVVAKEITAYKKSQEEKGEIISETQALQALKKGL